MLWYPRTQININCQIDYLPFINPVLFSVLVEFVSSQTISVSRYSGVIKITEITSTGSKYFRKRLPRIPFPICTDLIALYLSCDIPTVKNIEHLNKKLYTILIHLDNIRFIGWYVSSSREVTLR